MISVLLVDANSDEVRRLLASLPSDGTISFDSVPSAEQALERLRSGKYDIIVSEYSLESMNGTEFLRVLRAWGNEIPFIFFCAAGSDCIPLEALNNGADFFLEKREGGERVYAELLRIIQKYAGRRKAIEWLRRENQIMSAILTTSPLGICVIQNQTIIWTNNTMDRILGYPTGCLVGMDPHILIPDEKAHHRIDRWLYQETDASAWSSIESRLKRKDGSIVHCHMTARPVDPGDPSYGYIVTGQDMTEYEQMKELLRRSERRYVDLLENANSIIVRVDTGGTIRFINRFGEQFFGYAADEIVGKNVVGTILPRRSRSGRDLAAMVQEIMENPEDHAVIVNENMRKNGERVWIAWTNKPIRDDGGRVLEMLSIGNDITERQLEVPDASITVAPWVWNILKDTDVEGEVFEVIYALSVEISREGREGKRVGTAFLIGDTESVLARSRQLILNPFEGHAADLRRISNPDLKETLKELSQLDGAFVITGDGIVEAAARYITIDTSEMPLPRGWGTRHASVAGITRVTKAVGIVVSQSGGRISIFRGGRAVKIVSVLE